MSKSGTRLRPHRHRRRHMPHPKDTVFEVPRQMAEPPDSPFGQQPASASDLRRHVRASLVQHHGSVERNGCTLEPVSPASYSSSMEVAPCNRAVTPTSSLDFKGKKIRESSYNPKTSTELLTVLNRIWSLEEKHASNISVVKALKRELDLSRIHVKELLQEKQTNRQEMDNLVKQITEEKLVRKNKGHDRIKVAVQSVKEELEDERRLRKHSESLHRRMTRELSEVKSSFFGSLRDLEREKKARILLENLCDEFAKGIRDYEQEVCSLRQNVDKGEVKGDSLDRPILHISEAWLDERIQAANDLPERNSIVDKLGFDIEAFLHAKKSVDFRRYGNSSHKELEEIYPCRPSLDSFPLKEAISAPHNMAEEDSIGTEFFEQKGAAEVHLEKNGSHNSRRKQVQSKEITEECQLQVNMGKNMACDDNESWFIERKSSDVAGDNTALLNLNAPAVSNFCEATTQGPQESDRPWTRAMNSSHRLDNLVGNSSFSSEGDKIYPESICRQDSCVHAVVTGNASPVKQWKSKLVAPNFDKSESSSKLTGEVKDNTLMAKLLEARLEGQRSRSRASKSSF